MSVNVSFHPLNTPKISASSTRTSGCPLSIKVDTGHRDGHGDITIYTYSQAYTDALIAAINAVPVLAAPNPVAFEEDEQ